MTNSAQSTSDAAVTDVQTSNNPVGKSQINDNLDTIDKIINELSSVAPQSVASSIDNTADTLNPENPTRSTREKAESSAALDAAPIESGGGVQVVEYETTPEIPVEVESFLHRVEDHQDQAPDEIVIADGSVETVKANYPSTPVVVLPITAEEEKEGEKQPPVFSIRWLVEFSHKIVKMFAGKVIYKDNK